MISATTLAKKAMLRVLPPIYRWLSCLSVVLYCCSPYLHNISRYGFVVSRCSTVQALPSSTEAAVAAANAYPQGNTTPSARVHMQYIADQHHTAGLGLCCV